MKILFYITIILLVLDLTVSGCLEPSDIENISVNVLVNGSLIHGANGILFNGGDTLFIASVFGREILVMDPDTGQIINRLGKSGKYTDEEL